MTTKQPTPFFSLVVTALLASFVIISCNNNAEEKKELAPPSAVASPDSGKLKKDSIPMDSADTKPVKTTNE